MPRTPRDVTEAELAVLRTLWDRGPASVRVITADLAERGSPAQAATVQKLLERLEDKGWVIRDRTGPVQRFAATADRDDLIGRRLRWRARSGIQPRLRFGFSSSRSIRLRKARRSAADSRSLWTR